MTRRTFLRTSLSAAVAIASGPLILPRRVLGTAGTIGANDRINLGCIGVGPQGRGVMGGFLADSGARVVALCDVAAQNLNIARDQVNQRYQDPAKTCVDYHEILESSEIDAVLIATPDHWHVPIALAAAESKKDIYLEKPIGLSVEEDQLLRKRVLEHHRVFQFGTQQRSSREFRQACALVRNGKIGQLKKINVWCSASRPGGSTTAVPVPPGLEYDRWLGPSRFTPYTVDKCFDNSVPGAWKTWWFNYDYALGFIAGWGVHPLDVAYWGHPSMMKGRMTVEGKAVIPEEGACNTGIAWDVRFAFADGVRMEYRGTPNGYNQISALNDLSHWQNRYGQLPDHGTAFEGSDGWVMVYRGGLRTSPAGLAEEPIPTNPIQLVESSNHVRNFLESIRKRTTTVCPIEDAVQADILCHLSDISTRLGRPVEWDAEKEQFVSDPEANRRLAKRPARKGWPS